MFKKSKIKSLETTIHLLAGFHAVPLDNQQFLLQYRHLISMYRLLCTQAKSKPIL